MTKFLRVAMGVLVAVSVFGADVAGADSDHTLRGTFKLVGGSNIYDEQCAGIDAFESVHPGAKVVVRDGSGEIVGIGRLGRGKFHHGPLGNPPPPGAPTSCRYSFTVKVSDTKFYDITVAGVQSDAPYSRGELKKASWRVALTAGDPGY